MKGIINLLYEDIKAVLLSLCLKYIPPLKKNHGIKKYKKGKENIPSLAVVIPYRDNAWPTAIYNTKKPAMLSIPEFLIVSYCKW